MVTGRAQRSVIGAGAIVRGTVIDSVVWPGARVEAAERLSGTIRAGETLTVVAAHRRH